MKSTSKQTAAQTLDFTDIFNAYHSDILNYISYKTNGNPYSEDITMEVFGKVNNSLSTFDVSKASLTTWIHWIANNAIIDFHRKNKYNSKNVNVSDYVDSEGNEMFQIANNDDSANEVENSELLESVSKAFAALKPNYKMIAQLFFVEEKKYNEIAEICNVPMGTVKGMISRCRVMLQAELQTEKMRYAIA